MLTLSRLTYRLGSRVLFEETSLNLPKGARVGLVGPNGAGKSTLFKIITGELHADGGEVLLPAQASLAMVKQDLPSGTITPLEIVLAADTRRAALLAQLETEVDPNHLGEIYAELDHIGAYAAPARAAIILAGLGFTEAQQNSPIEGFSGGWRMRVALAATLFVQPDVLLLDEPTNHLDLDAIMWLEEYLASYPHTIFLISHDRELLNKCCTHIAHLDNKKLTLYTGGFDQFINQYNLQKELLEKSIKKQAAQRAHLQSFVDRFKAKASKAKQAQSRMKAIEKMPVLERTGEGKTVTFNFPTPDELAPPLFSALGVNIGYGPGKTILRNVGLRLDQDDRIALLGANGNGKSTLVKFIAGALAGEGGEVYQSPKLRIGYYDQYQAETLDLNDSPYNVMADYMRAHKAIVAEAAVRAKLGQFHFSKDQMDGKISALSGGERARLLFALISYNAPNILLLDEPTNHLDLASREALVQALNDYQGAVVLVSHDPSLIERVADRLWLVADGQVKDFTGDLADYRQYVLDLRRQQSRAASKAKASAVAEEATEAAPKKVVTLSPNQRRKRFPQLFAAAQAAEQALAKLTQDKAAHEAALQDPAVYNNPAQLKTHQQALKALTPALAEAETTWLAAQQAYEGAG